MESIMIYSLLNFFTVMNVNWNILYEKAMMYND